jgi:hypothetical protein
MMVGIWARMRSALRWLAPFHRVGLLVVEGEGGHRRAEDRHGVGVRGRLAQEIQDGGGEGPLATQVGREVVELGLGGKLAVAEQVHDLFERGVVGEVVDVVAAVDELALVPIDGGQSDSRAMTPSSPRALMGALSVVNSVTDSWSAISKNVCGESRSGMETAWPSRPKGPGRRQAGRCERRCRRAERRARVQ